jgi:hypothetical protein
LKDHGHVADLLALTGLLAEDNPLFAAARPTHSNERRTSLPQNAGVERPLFNLVIDRFGSKAVIASVTGTETDPQGYSRQVKTRRARGGVERGGGQARRAGRRYATGVQSSTPTPITMSTA